MTLIIDTVADRIFPDRLAHRTAVIETEAALERVPTRTMSIHGCTIIYGDVDGRGHWLATVTGDNPKLTKATARAFKRLLDVPGTIDV